MEELHRRELRILRSDAPRLEDLVRLGRSALSGRVDNPTLEARVLLAHACALNPTDILIYPERSARPEQATEYRQFLERRATGEPVAYILGHREFMDLRFRVNPAVLIPRPETEELVEQALPTLPGSGTILDLCCGSGCIGISVAHRRRGAVHLSDISPAAVACARQNVAELFSAERAPAAQVFVSDLFAALPEGRRYSAILSNPPYVHPSEAADLAVDVRSFEPDLALFHSDPPELYRRIVRESARRLKGDGVLWLELAPAWATDVLKAARESFRRAEIRQDATGRERFLFAVGPQD